MEHCERKIKVLMEHRNSVSQQLDHTMVRNVYTGQGRITVTSMPVLKICHGMGPSVQGAAHGTNFYI